MTACMLSVLIELVPNILSLQNYVIKTMVQKLSRDN